MATWRELISHEMSERGETWADVQACTLTDAELDVEFDSRHGLIEGQPFTLWTSKRVYFPVDYDGAENAASVPRRPSAEATGHVGGGGGS